MEGSARDIAVSIATNAVDGAGEESSREFKGEEMRKRNDGQKRTQRTTNEQLGIT